MLVEGVGEFFAFLGEGLVDEAEEGFVVFDDWLFVDVNFEDCGVYFWLWIERGWGNCCYYVWFSEVLDVDCQDV